MNAWTLALACVLTGSSVAQAADEQRPDGVDHARVRSEEKVLTDAFRNEANFEMHGVVLGADVRRGGLLVERGTLPVAFLVVPDTAMIVLNGRAASLSDVQPGADVRATFNLVQQYPMALKLVIQQSSGPTLPKTEVGH